MKDKTTAFAEDLAVKVTMQALKEDRDQAYNRLVEGIEGMTYAMNVDEYLELVEKWEGKNYDQPFDDGYAQALKDIIENVVKPLYGKE
jgi:hypothetical protein